MQWTSQLKRPWGISAELIASLLLLVDRLLLFVFSIFYIKRCLVLLHITTTKTNQHSNKKSYEWKQKQLSYYLPPPPLHHHYRLSTKQSLYFSTGVFQEDHKRSFNMKKCFQAWLTCTLIFSAASESGHSSSPSPVSTSTSGYVEENRNSSSSSSSFTSTTEVNSPPPPPPHAAALSFSAYSTSTNLSSTLSTATAEARGETSNLMLHNKRFFFIFPLFTFPHMVIRGRICAWVPHALKFNFL